MCKPCFCLIGSASILLLVMFVQVFCRGAYALVGFFRSFGKIMRRPSAEIRAAGRIFELWQQLVVDEFFAVFRLRRGVNAVQNKLVFRHCGRFNSQKLIRSFFKLSQRFAEL